MRLGLMVPRAATHRPPLRLVSQRRIDRGCCAWCPPQEPLGQPRVSAERLRTGVPECSAVSASWHRESLGTGSSDGRAGCGQRRGISRCDGSARMLRRRLRSCPRAITRGVLGRPASPLPLGAPGSPCGQVSVSRGRGAGELGRMGEEPVLQRRLVDRDKRGDRLAIARDGRQAAGELDVLDDGGGIPGQVADGDGWHATSLAAPATAMSGMPRTRRVQVGHGTRSKSANAPARGGSPITKTTSAWCSMGTDRGGYCRTARRRAAR